MKLVKYKDRIKKRACPLCGCTKFDHNDGHASYPEVWRWDSCANCGCVVGFADNSPWYDLWDEIKQAGVCSKAKVLDIVRQFYDGSNENRGFL